MTDTRITVMKNAVSYETRKLAREVGFDQPCFYVTDEDTKVAQPLIDANGHIYLVDAEAADKNNLIPTPTQCLLIDWLRESMGVDVSVQVQIPARENTKWKVLVYDIATANRTPKQLYTQIGFDNHTDAADAGIKEALTYTGEKKKTQEKRI